MIISNKKGYVPSDRMRFSSYVVRWILIYWESCPLFTHPQVWAGIDKLAQLKGWSPSRLAREAGLDPTTFNKSKRHTNQAKPRWPSTESLAKILAATSTSLESFITLMADDASNEHEMPSKRLRCFGYNDVAGADLFDEAGFPTDADWDEIDFPGVNDKHAFALEVQGNRLFPVFRDGDILIVLPGTNVRRGDRVLLKTKSKELQAGILSRRSAQRLQIEVFGENGGNAMIPLNDVAWLSRVVWARLGS